MSDLGAIGPRVQAIRAKVSQLQLIAGPRQLDGQPLGFGLALQNAALDAQTAPDPVDADIDASTAHTQPSDELTPGGPLSPNPLSAQQPGTQQPGTRQPGTESADSLTPTTGPSSPPAADVSPATSPSTLLDGRSTTDAVALTPATVRSGSYGRLVPPAELVPFGNGRIPAEALAQIGDTRHRLYQPAADALNLLRVDAEAAGVTIGITDSYRPLAMQESLAERKGLYSQGGLAAYPGTSNHGWGLALDLDLDSSALAWMRANAARYGYVEDVPREPWHWTYRPDPT